MSVTTDRPAAPTEATRKSWRKQVGGPVPPRSRSWGLVALAGTLVLALGLAGAYLISNAGAKESVVSVAGSGVAKGQVIEREDLVSTSVSGVAGTIPISDIDTVVGKTAAVDLVQGQLLRTEMLSTDPVPGEGQATVGLALEPTRVPANGLQPGDVVDVIGVPSSESGGVSSKDLDSPTVLSKSAEVYSVRGSATGGGQVLLTLVVQDRDSARLAAYSTQNRVAVVETAPTVADESGQ